MATCPIPSSCEKESFAEGSWRKKKRERVEQSSCLPFCKVLRCVVMCCVLGAWFAVEERQRNQIKWKWESTSEVTTTRLNDKCAHRATCPWLTMRNHMRPKEAAVRRACEEPWSFYYVVIIYGLLLIFDIKIVFVWFKCVYVHMWINEMETKVRCVTVKRNYGFFSLFNYVVEWHHLKSHEIPVADNK